MKLTRSLAVAALGAASLAVVGTAAAETELRRVRCRQTFDEQGIPLP